MEKQGAIYNDGKGNFFQLVVKTLAVMRPLETEICPGCGFQVVKGLRLCENCGFNMRAMY